MAVSIEFLKDQKTGSRTGKAWLNPCTEGAWEAGFIPRVTSKYQGKSQWLCIMGIGDARYCKARDEHVASGRPVACWDMGYIGKSKFELETCHMRVSLNTDHPSHVDLDRTKPDPSRWSGLGIRTLKNVSRSDGPVLVIGMGSKFHNYLGEHGWELNALQAAAKRFPDREVVYRRKPRLYNHVDVDWPNVAEDVPIAELLIGASLVICRHSNVAIDACLAGVPVECESGAAHWLYSRGSTPTEAERLDFLYRLTWWQWRLTSRDMGHGWKFLREFYGRSKN